jgi:monovalent cation/proton antiporter MnhG/PhaG subunit
MTDFAVAVLLAIGVAVELICCLGLVAMEGVYDRLHYTGPAATLGPAAIATAVLVEEGFSQSGFKALFVALLLAVFNPVLVHATARAARIRESGQWQPRTKRSPTR